MSEYPDPPEVVSSREFPEDLYENIPRWLFSKVDDDGAKRPRAPWRHPDWPDRYVDHKNPHNWTTGHQMDQYMGMYLGQGYEPAFSIPNYEMDGDDLDGAVATRHVLIDHDDVIVDGNWHPASKKLVERFDSYSQVSASFEGIHTIVQGKLPEPGELPQDGIDAEKATKLDVSRTSVDIDISNEDFPDAEIEVYDNGRYAHMTGNRITSAPSATKDRTDELYELARKHADSIDERADGDDNVSVNPEALERDTTTSKKVVFEAMQQIDSRDIRLESTKTKDRGNGVVDYDPSWASSDSGTRLGKLGDDHFLYRAGNTKLDTLQVVALEEGIVSDPDETIEGDQWWNLADALRRRGAHIPRLTPGAMKQKNPWKNA